MDIRPKRKKSKDNPYTIYKNNSTYLVEFIDGKGTLQKVEISEEVFKEFDKFELVDKSQMTKCEKYIASYDLSEEYINEKAVDKQVTIDDEVIMKATFEELRKAIDTLPKIQKQRIKMYYFENLTADEISKKTNCTQHAVRKSIRYGILNLKEILKK